jgi:hypothetical protein
MNGRIQSLSKTPAPLFDGNGLLQTDEHWWNAFLLSTDVGFENMGHLLSEPVADHALLEGYAENLEKYLSDLTPVNNPSFDDDSPRRTITGC